MEFIQLLIEFTRRFRTLFRGRCKCHVKCDVARDADWAAFPLWEVSQLIQYSTQLLD